MSDLGTKQYAENVAGSGGSGGSSEPSDDYEEVATGMCDADGNMIFKRAFKGNTSTGNTITTEMNFNQHQIYDVKGNIQLDNNMNVVPNFYANASYYIYPYLTSSDLRFEKGANPHFSNANYTITVYYTYKPVLRTTARKTTTK